MVLTELLTDWLPASYAHICSSTDINKQVCLPAFLCPKQKQSKQTHTHTRLSLSMITADPTPSFEQSGNRSETVMGWEKCSAGRRTREVVGKRKMVRDGRQWIRAGRTINLERGGKWSHSDEELESDKSLQRDGEDGRGVRLHGVMAGPPVGQQVIAPSIEWVMSEQLLTLLNCGSGRGQSD